MNKGVKTKSTLDSPKTPGGISKSLLTPCRRVGLSRNWGKRGPSPFISPLSGGNNSAEVKIEKEPKKRKRCDSDIDTVSVNGSEHECTPKSSVCDTIPDISNTPTRTVPLNKKKSKTLLMKDNKESESIDTSEDKSLKAEENSKDTEILSNIKLLKEQVSPISKLSRTNSRNKLKNKQSKNINTTENGLERNNENMDINSQTIKDNVKEKSPNNLTKECIVVIQKKMIKNMDLDKHDKQDDKTQITTKSQTLFDSDSDDTPLCALSKKENKQEYNKEFDDDDFTQTKVKKLQDKNTSTTGLKTKKSLSKKPKPKTVEIASQNSFEDDDDFEFSNKRTILIKKSYDKVVKPLKAKSTGSITQNDIDEIRARIEMKKKLLVATSITEDTEELRNLIKKWQKGCQEALCQLFDLMRKKFPDKQNMDYSEILQTLKIPPDLIGYDVENDCFVTPDDTSVILSSINT